MSSILDNLSTPEEVDTSFPGLALFDLPSCIKEVNSQLESINDSFISYYQHNKVSFENYISWAPFCRSLLPEDRYNLRDGINIRAEEDRQRDYFKSDKYVNNSVSNNTVSNNGEEEKEANTSHCVLKQALLRVCMHPNEVTFNALPDIFFNNASSQMVIASDRSLMLKRKAESQLIHRPKHEGFQFMRALKYHESVGSNRGKREDEDCNCIQGKCLGGDCLNFSSQVECGPGCRAPGCENNRIRLKKWIKLDIKNAGSHGKGAYASQDILPRQFITEYVGEVISQAEHTRRTIEKQETHFYTVQLDRLSLIDASEKGNLARFMNHSCEPNCASEKWTVKGETRVGLFAIKPIKKGQEITWDYQYEAKAGEEKIPCLCGTPSCTKFLGNKK